MKEGDKMHKFMRTVGFSMYQKKRDMEVVKTTLVYQNLLVEQAGRLKKKAYPVIGSNPADCMAD